MSKSKSGGNLLSKLILASSILWFVYIGLYRTTRCFLLKNYSVCKKALIIDKQNIVANDNLKWDVTYSYEFQVNGDIYESDSNIPGLRVGDSILIEYVKFYPFFNKPIINEKKR